MTIKMTIKRRSSVTRESPMIDPLATRVALEIKSGIDTARRAGSRCSYPKRVSINGCDYIFKDCIETVKSSEASA